MNKFFLLITALLTTLALQSFGNPTEEKNPPSDSIPPAWTFKGKSSVTLTQVSLSNWVAGGENAYTLNTGLDFSALYKKGNNSWDNNIKLGYGFAWQESDDHKISNADFIDLASKYGRHASNSWDYSLLLGFKTQFDKGYKNATDTIKASDFLSPAYLTLSAGMNYKKNGLTIMASPLSGKMTIVNSAFLNGQALFGVDTGKVTRTELGGLAKFEYESNYWKKRVKLKTSVEFFSNYKDNPQNIDVNWNFDLNFKLNSVISFQIQFQTIYDDDTKIAIKDSEGNVIKNVAKLQVREFIGFGLTYMFDTTPPKPEEKKN